MLRRIVIGTALATLIVCTTTPRFSAAESHAGPSIATFEGTLIDLRDGWGEATACTSDGITTECFRTEQELDEYLEAATGYASSLLQGFAIESVCSTSLKLYSNTSYGGSVLALSTRSTILNLSTWSFNNVTSSYKVGACNSTFYDGANAGAPTYPGNTAAGASATSMLAGWDNRVSSVIIS